MPNAISIELIEEQVESWSREYVRPAFLGDIEAAGRLSVALNNHRRGAMAVAMWRAKVPRDAFREFFGGVWQHDHRHVIDAAGTRRRLQAMFRYADFPLPDDFGNEVQVWRGTSALSFRKASAGFSWTLDRDVACWFAMRFADRNGSPLVLSATVPRSDIALYTNERSEQEVVLLVPPTAAIDGDAIDWEFVYEQKERQIRADKAAGLGQ